ncbi:hypothetical protein D3C71_2150690 [compost metagenome]
MSSTMGSLATVVSLMLSTRRIGLTLLSLVSEVPKPSDRVLLAAITTLNLPLALASLASRVTTPLTLTKAKS